MQFKVLALVAALATITTSVDAVAITERGVRFFPNLSSFILYLTLTPLGQRPRGPTLYQPQQRWNTDERRPSGPPYGLCQFSRPYEQEYLVP